MSYVPTVKEKYDRDPQGDNTRYSYIRKQQIENECRIEILEKSQIKLFKLIIAQKQELRTIKGNRRP